MTALTILCSLILAALVILIVFIALSYQQLVKFNLLNSAYQADEYRKATTIQKVKKAVLPAAKQETRGRSVSKTDDLVDLADIPWEKGYKIIEELGNGESA